MARSPIDRGKLSVHARRLHKRDLLALLDRAIELVPATRLPEIVKPPIAPDTLRPDGASPARLLDAVQVFREASLRGDYYEEFAVNWKNSQETSRGTDAWIAECERLFVRCVSAAKKRPDTRIRAAFELLFDLLRNMGRDETLFFADEGGPWQVGLDWPEVLRRYFACLAVTADPDEYARAASSVIDGFVAHDRDRYLPVAHSAATPAQEQALRRREAEKSKAQT
jgi:hypothetical protein